MPDSAERSFQEELARSIDPSAWQYYDDPALLESTRKAFVQPSITIAAKVEAFLASRGISTAAPQNLGEALNASKAAIEDAQNNLEAFKSAARGDLDDVLSKLATLNEDIEDLTVDIACDVCGDYSADGDGFDGLCGNCADKAERMPFEDAYQVDKDPDNSAWTYEALLYEDENKRKGLWHVDRDIKASTRLLYDTPAEARAAAKDLAHGEPD